MLGFAVCNFHRLLSLTSLQITRGWNMLKLYTHIPKFYSARIVFWHSCSSSSLFDRTCFFQQSTNRMCKVFLHWVFWLQFISLAKILFCLSSRCALLSTLQKGSAWFNTLRSPSSLSGVMRSGSIFLRIPPPNISYCSQWCLCQFQTWFSGWLLPPTFKSYYFIVR